MIWAKDKIAVQYPWYILNLNLVTVASYESCVFDTPATLACSLYMRLDSNKTLCSFYCTVQSVLRYVNNSLKFKNNQYEIQFQMHKIYLGDINDSRLLIFLLEQIHKKITDYRHNHQKWPTSNKQPTYLFNQVLYLLGTKISFMMLPIIGKFPKIDLVGQKCEDYYIFIYLTVWNNVRNI